MEWYFKALLLLTLGCSALQINVSSPEWDYLVFAQQWPQSICIDSSITHQHKCRIATNITTWTTHGIWPTKIGTKGPSFCNSSKPFDPKAIEDILPKLKKYWPNLYTDTPLDDFWDHEWSKHGRCAAVLDTLNSEEKYFQMGVDLNRNYDYLTYLGKSHIEPKANHLYPYGEVQRAFRQQFGVNVTIQCVWDKETKTQYLTQVEVCLNKTFSMIECPEGKSSHLSDNIVSKGKLSGFGGRFNSIDLCRDTEDIAYPVILH